MKRLLITCLFLTAMISGIGQTKSFLDVPYLEVNGSADTMITPNEIWIQITISEGDVKNRISVEDQERKMVAGLKSLGINSEKELTTSGMQSDFRFYVLKQKDVLKTKSYKLKVGTAVLATRVFMKLEELGIANASIEKVSHSDMTGLRNRCRTMAVAQALAKAQALTAPLGAKVGMPLHIVDYSNDGDTPVGIALMGKASGIMADAAVAELPEIDFEKIRISMSVNVKFLLK